MVLNLTIVNSQPINSLACSTRETQMPDEQKYYCSVCGREISKEDNEDYDGMCWECWDDQLTEESEDMFGDEM